MTVVDGAVYTVPTDQKEDFTRFAQDMCQMFVQYGALHVVDAWGLDVPDGEVTSFPMAVQAKDNETVCYSWIIWPSEDTRKEAWDKIMKDEKMMQGPEFIDGKRMIMGTFEVVAEAK